MASLRQITANRSNALKSTGPRSPEGKARSSQNASRHGLAGHANVVLPAEIAKCAEERKVHWRNQFQPDAPVEEWAFAHICVESVRLDQIVQTLIAQADEQAQHALESWDDDRKLDIERLAAGLSKQPEIVALQLIQTVHGCEWLIEQWKEVRARLNADGGWKPSLWTRALDLLGIAHRDRDRATPSLLGKGMVLKEGLEMIESQLEELNRRKTEYLEARDARQRADAEEGTSAVVPPALKNLRRYHRETFRRLQWFWKELRRLQKERSAAHVAPAPPSSQPIAAPPPPSESL